jgi:DDE domain
MFLLRGIQFTYEAVRDWGAKLTPPLIDDLRRRRGGGSRVRRSRYVDKTYIEVNARWCYPYRAIDRTGALVDVMLSEIRDMAAAEKFFRSAKAVTGVTRPGWPLMGTTVTLVRFDASLVLMSATGTASIATTALSRIIEGSRADMGQRAASVPFTRRLAFADVMTNSGTSCTPVTASAKPHQPPRVAIVSFGQAASPPRYGFVMSGTMEKELALHSARGLTEPSGCAALNRV